MQPMARFLLEHALLGNSWARSVLVTTKDNGIIKSIKPEPKLYNANDLTRITGHTLPGIANLHSHAFQRAMAGLAERAGGANDSFWTWRTVMYDFLKVLRPDHVEAVAAQLYVELLKHGYTSVAEFHYLHHDQDGAPYENPGEMSERVISAAQTANIGLCHLPVLYGFSGFGEQKPTAGQRRFINDPNQFLKLIDSLNDAHAPSPLFNIGMAAHSLRAVSPATLGAVLEGFKTLRPGAPVHIHIAEQVGEVEDCLAWCGKRPVEFLYDQFEVDKKWCLIHATHLNDDEIDLITASGAVAGICPTTEANLGDGIFPGIDFLAKG
ncbi:MAG: formimidoylglutamate deiminase, partial [Fimbriimonadaceae bacterium]|nr:formimidoylglutamate deiminase [Alphaproteobacteria bacterium]